MMPYERAKAIGWAYVDSGGQVWDAAQLNQARATLARHGSVGARQLLELMGDVRAASSAWNAPVVSSVPAPARASSDVEGRQA